MRMRRAVLTVLILASATFASDAGAQVTPAANRVRVVESCPCSGCACGSISKRTLIVGQLVRQTNDSVVIVPDSLSAQGTEHVFLFGCGFDFGRGFSTYIGASLYGMAGLVIGGIVGARNTHEVWRPMAERGVRMAIAPTAKGGAQFTARMSF